MDISQETTKSALYTLRKVMPNIDDDIRNNYEKQKRINQIKGR